MYKDFYPNFKKEKENLKGVLANHVTKADLKKNADAGDWPIAPRGDVTERSYREWLEKCVDPRTNEYYLARDENNLPIKGTEPKYLITAIYRVKTQEDLNHDKPSEEILLSKGSVVGHDSNGDELQFPITFPERWFKNIYKFTTEYDSHAKAMVKQCQGVSTVEKVYELKFSEKAAKSLLDQRASDKIQFVVKDEGTGRAVNVEPDVNLPKTFERFMKPFEYVFSGNYLSQQQKADAHRRGISEGLIRGTGSDVSNMPPDPPKGAYS